MTRRILVWDLPVRVFHWLLATAFVAEAVLGDAAANLVERLAAGKLAKVFAGLNFVVRFDQVAVAGVEHFERVAFELRNFCVSLAGFAHEVLVGIDKFIPIISASNAVLEDFVNVTDGSVVRAS